MTHEATGANLADGLDTQAASQAASPVVLDVRGLVAEVQTPRGSARLVDSVSLSVAAGKTLAVVGESGSGKTMTFLSVLGIAPPAVRVTAGQVLLGGRDVLASTPEQLRAMRGTVVSMVFQDPLTALNPVFTVGTQISEVLRAHLPISAREARERAVALLERVHIPSPARRLDDYPHQFSGGMRQRVLIAMAIALGPRVLIADEPTTALDVTVQAQILELLTQLREETGMALVLITHDLGLVARHADDVAVFYAGRIVERTAVDPLFAEPRHPYTTSLFRSIPRLDDAPGTKLTPIAGLPPNLTALPPGCAFAARCDMRADDCTTRRPELVPAPGPDHLSACLYWRRLAADASPS